MTSWLGLVVGGLVFAAVLILAARFVLMRRTALPVAATHLNNSVRWADFQTEWTDTDRMVDKAERIWPYVFGDPKRDIPVPPMAIFYFNVLSSAFLVTMGVMAASALAMGAIGGFALFGLLALTAQLMQWGVSIRREPLDVAGATLLVMLTLFNIGLSLIGASVFGNAQDTRTAISVNATTDTLAKREALTKELANIQSRRTSSLPVETLRAQAKAARDREVCESWLGNGRRVCPQDKVEAREYGGKCGPKCQEFKADADKLAAQLADAERARSIQTEIAGLNKSLGEKSDAQSVRTQAEFFQIAGEKIGQQHVMPIVVIFIALIDAILCFMVGQEARARHKHYVRLAKESGNAILADRGLPPRYTIDAHEVAEHETAAAKPGDNITISIDANPEEIVAASADLQEIRKLLDEVTSPEEGKSLTFGQVYNVYRGRAMAAGRDKWMSRQRFMSAIQRYAEIMKIPHAGSRLLNVRLPLAIEAEVASSEDATEKGEAA